MCWLVLCFHEGSAVNVHRGRDIGVTRGLQLRRCAGSSGGAISEPSEKPLNEKGSDHFDLTRSAIDFSSTTEPATGSSLFARRAHLAEPVHVCIAQNIVAAAGFIGKGEPSVRTSFEEGVTPDLNRRREPRVEFDGIWRSVNGRRGHDRTSIREGRRQSARWRKRLRL
jgi:hypothetical protein